MLDSEYITLDILDTTGQEDYDYLRSMSYPGTNVFLVCFSVVCPGSFEDVANTWAPEIEYHCPGVPKILVGTQLELREDKETIDSLKRAKMAPITQRQGEAMRKQIGAVAYMECSEVTQVGLNDIFYTAARVGLGKNETGHVKKETGRVEKELDKGAHCCKKLTMGNVSYSTTSKV